MTNYSLFIRYFYYITSCVSEFSFTSESVTVVVVVAIQLVYFYLLSYLAMKTLSMLTYLSIYCFMLLVLFTRYIENNKVSLEHELSLVPTEGLIKLFIPICPDLETKARVTDKKNSIRISELGST